MKYFLKGVEVVPKNVSPFSLQLQEGDFGNGYNFKCDTLNLRVDIDGIECPYDAEFVIKVSYTIESEGSKPVERIDSVKDNRISLKRN